jgi:hypothetical protein
MRLFSHNGVLFVDAECGDDEKARERVREDVRGAFEEVIGEKTERCVKFRAWV